MIHDPGAPHLAPNLIAEIIWTTSFLVSLAFGTYQVATARAYELARRRLQVNGAAELESRLLMRAALIRVAVSIMAATVGVWALLTPDNPVPNLFTVGAFVVLAVGYAAPAVLEVLYGIRQIRILNARRKGGPPKG